MFDCIVSSQTITCALQYIYTTGRKSLFLLSTLAYPNQVQSTAFKPPDPPDIGPGPPHTAGNASSLACTSADPVPTALSSLSGTTPAHQPAATGHKGEPPSYLDKLQRATPHKYFPVWLAALNKAQSFAHILWHRSSFRRSRLSVSRQRS